MRVVRLQRMRYFVAVAHELHFGRAAERLHLAQPGLSQQIRVLERELGVELLVRGPAGVQLTGPGRVFLEEAEAIVRRADEAVERTRAAAEGYVGRLRVIYTRSAPELGRDVMTPFRARFPDVCVVAETAWTARNLELLRSDAADVGFVRLPLEDEECIELLALTAEEAMLALPAGHRLAAKRLVRREELADEPLVQWPRVQAPGAYDALLASVWKDRRPRVVVEEPDDEHVLTAVAEGAGVAFFHESSVPRLRRAGIVFRRIADAPVMRYGLAWPRDTENAVRERFVEVAAASVAAPAVPATPAEAR